MDQRITDYDEAQARAQAEAKRFTALVESREDEALLKAWGDYLSALAEWMKAVRGMLGSGK